MSSRKLLVDILNATEALEAWEPDQCNNGKKQYEGDNPMEEVTVLSKGEQCA